MVYRIWFAYFYMCGLCIVIKWNMSSYTKYFEIFHGIKHTKYLETVYGIKHLYHPLTSVTAPSFVDKYHQTNNSELANIQVISHEYSEVHI